jgi:hypothetical protein
MNLYFLIWSFGLGVLAGLIVAVVRDEYHRRKRWRSEASAVRRMRDIQWAEAETLFGFPIIPSDEIPNGEIKFGRYEDIRWP